MIDPILTGEYKLSVGDETKTFVVQNGGIFSLAVFQDAQGKLVVSKDTILSPFSLSVFLQVKGISRKFSVFWLPLQFGDCSLLSPAVW